MSRVSRAIRCPRRRVDLALAGATFLLLAVLLPVVPDGPDRPAGLVAGLALAGVQAGTLLWMGRHPEAALAVAAVAGVGLELLSPRLGWLGLITLPMNYYATVRPPRASLWALGVLLLPTPWKLRTGGWRDVLIAATALALAWAIGELQRSYRLRRQAEARRILTEERARIARELHDIVAHNVSVIVVQASAAEDVFDTSPDRARAALGSIASAGRAALGELRTLLETMRPDQPDQRRDPQPGLAALDSLVDSVRAAGLPVVVRREGNGPAVPEGVGLSAYRIVQESLTNALRHARAGRAEVTVRYAPSGVDLEIVDDGSGGPVGPLVHGHGIVGMRERVRLHGGTLDAGPRPGGGFRVAAHLPTQGVGG